jgi:hypothetical protein
LSYEDRLKEWDLTTLEERRVRSDLIQMYKVVKKFKQIDWYTGRHYATPTGTRASLRNNYRLERETFSSRNKNNFGHFVSIRHNFFSNRTSVRWNDLENYQIEVDRVNSFKARIDAPLNQLL